MGKRLAKTTIGDPKVDGVRMGSLAGNEQKEEVTEKVNQLAKSQEIVFGSLENFDVIGANKDKKLYLGSVKSNIGHTEPTSGLASILKVCLIMIYKKLLPCKAPVTGPFLFCVENKYK